MTTDNWIALAAFVIPTFGAICVAAYHLIKLLIKSSADDQEIARLKDKIDQLKEHIKEMQ